MPLLLSPKLLDRARQRCRYVAREHAGVAEVAADEFAGGAVEVDAEGGGLEGLDALGDEAGDGAGEDVAGAAGGETGVGEGAEAGAAVGRGDDRVRALEDDGEVPLGGVAAGRGGAGR